jgi:dihydroxyacetone kinase-like protein
VSATAGELEEVYRVTAKARDNTRSMGVAVAAGSIPETGEPTFELGADEIEIGMGLHGEPGVSRQKLLRADALVDMMMDRILSDLPFRQGEEVCLLMNNLGATTMMELLIANRRVRQILANRDILVYDTVAGSFCTSQEMAGFSITLMKLDDELKRYYDMPASSFAFTKR